VNEKAHAMCLVDNNNKDLLLIFLLSISIIAPYISAT
jgi:hypothetical protein